MKLLLLALVASFAIGCGDSPTAPSANNVPCAPTYHRLYAADGSYTCVPNS